MPRRIALGLTTRAAFSIASVFAAFGIGCAELTSPLPAGSERFDAPPVYSAWWKEIEDCSGIRGSLSDVNWYVVPGARFLSLPHDDEQLAAYTEYADNRIVITGEAQMVGSIVRHEMLHDLVRVGGHPRKFFFERCGGLVQCAGSCAADAGPPPTPAKGTPLVPGDSFDVTISIRPTLPSFDTLGGYFQVVVKARNRAHHAVVLEPPAPPDPLPAGTFGWVFGASGAEIGFQDIAWDSEVTLFQAGETKSEVFDFVVGKLPGAHQVEPGTYLIRGFFGAHVTAPITFVVAP